MAKQFITEAARMQKLAGIINETEENTIDEGLKNWIIGLGLTAATIAGGATVYQIDKAKENDQKIQKAYFDNVLSNVWDKMSDEDKSNLGTTINSIKKDMVYGSNYSADDLIKINSNYASKYIQKHPNEFSINPEDNTIHWKFEENQ